jgi:hypothetical protein
VGASTSPISNKAEEVTVFKQPSVAVKTTVCFIPFPQAPPTLD